MVHSLFQLYFFKDISEFHIALRQFTYICLQSFYYLTNTTKLRSWNHSLNNYRTNLAYVRKFDWIINKNVFPPFSHSILPVLKQRKIRIAFISVWLCSFYFSNIKVVQISVQSHKILKTYYTKIAISFFLISFSPMDVPVFYWQTTQILKKVKMNYQTELHYKGGTFFISLNTSAVL